MYTLQTILSVACIATSLALAAPAIQPRPIQPRPTRKFPFTQLVAFGDELSDNGNGSYAHGITGDPAFVYGYNTWTNGPVAVSFLTDLLGVPLVDYAFGGCCGGSPFGAVLDNNYTTGAAQWNGKPVPSLDEQIKRNYTLNPKNNIQNSLHFIWVGENDVSFHTDAYWQGDPKNTAFANEFASRITAEAEYLVSKGAPYVFVANIYPKHLAPVTKAYLCKDGSCSKTWGAVISQANAALKAKLAASPSASKFIYYDSFTYISNIFANKNAYGFTADGGAICDGGPEAQWQTCISGPYLWAGARKFFWMNYVQPTFVVHQMIAQDMANTIKKFFNVS